MGRHSISFEERLDDFEKVVVHVTVRNILRRFGTFRRYLLELYSPGVRFEVANALHIDDSVLRRLSWFGRARHQEELLKRLSGTFRFHRHYDNGRGMSVKSWFELDEKRLKEFAEKYLDPAGRHFTDRQRMLLAKYFPDEKEEEIAMTSRDFARLGAPSGWEPPRRKRTRGKVKKMFDVPGSVEYKDLDEAFPDGIDTEDPAQMKLLSDDCRRRLDAEARAEYAAFLASRPGM